MGKIVIDIENSIYKYKTVDLTGSLARSIRDNNSLRPRYEALTALAILDMRAHDFSNEKLEPYIYGLRNISLFGAGEVLRRFENEFDRTFIPRLADSECTLFCGESGESFVSGEREW